MAKTVNERISELLLAIQPLVKIADEYDKDGLDEARPSWISNGVDVYKPGTELYCGRGGKCLLTLEEALHARDVAMLKIHLRPVSDSRIAAIKKMYEASIPNISWGEMSESRRNEIIANYEKIGYP